MHMYSTLPDNMHISIHLQYREKYESDTARASTKYLSNKGWVQVIIHSCLKLDMLALAELSIASIN